MPCLFPGSRRPSALCRGHRRRRCSRRRRCRSRRSAPPSGWTADREAPPFWKSQFCIRPPDDGAEPILTFLAETREYVAGALRTGDRASWKEIAAHLDSAYAALPATVKTVYARADSGFYCWEAVQAYEKRSCRFIVVARKTAARLVNQLKAADVPCGSRSVPVSMNQRRWGCVSPGGARHSRQNSAEA